MLLENTETIQKLNPAILRRAGPEHIRDMDPEVVRKTDIRSLSSIDLPRSRSPSLHHPKAPLHLRWYFHRPITGSSVATSTFPT